MNTFNTKFIFLILPTHVKNCVKKKDLGLSVYLSFYLCICVYSFICISATNGTMKSYLTGDIKFRNRVLKTGCK